MTQYLVITSRVVGNPERGYTIEHYASEPCSTKRAAVRGGFEMYESDDFFIGVLERGKLARCEQIESSDTLHADSLAEIAKQIGYRLVKAKQPVDEVQDRAQSAGTPTQTATLPTVTFSKYESDKRDDARHGGAR